VKGLQNSLVSASFISGGHAKKQMYSSRKYPYSPYIRDWNFLGEGGLY